MAEEATDPGRDVPRAINYVIVAVLVVYIGMPLAGLSVMPVGSNLVPVDPATGMTVPVEVVPGEPEGTWVLASDPETTVFVPVEEVDGVQVITPQEPTGRGGGRRRRWRSTRLYGTQLGSNYLEDPVLGHGPLHARQRRLAADHPRALGRHPRRDDPRHRHQRRAHRGVAPHVLARASTASSRPSWGACTPSA